MRSFSFLRIVVFAVCLMAMHPSGYATATSAAGDTTAVRWAVTKYSTNYMREKPEYTEELGTQSLMGTIVKIVGESGYWRQVVTPEPYKAWCTNLGLVEMSDTEIKAYERAEKYICTAFFSSVYSSASRKSQTLSDLVAGDLLRVGGRNKNGFARVVLPDGTEGFVPRKDVEKAGKWKAGCELTPESVIAYAKRMLGVPYLWGGASTKGVDCSGLVLLSWRMNGGWLPRNASQQVKIGEEVPLNADFALNSDLEAFGKSFGKNAGNTFPDDTDDSDIKTENFDDLKGIEGLKQEMLVRTRLLEPGDLVFFGYPADGDKKERITHVGIYIGDGRIIHSSHEVRINSLIPGEPDFYENAFKLIRARRIL